MLHVANLNKNNFCNIEKLKCAILGTGNIGTDLLIKLQRSKNLECTLFTGRNFESKGLKKALCLGVNVSDEGIQAIINQAKKIDLVFDATSAAAHQLHWPIIESLEKLSINMTPAKIGEICIPAINVLEIYDKGCKNINMVTCGGQASVPIAHAISKVHRDIAYIEVVSSISSQSAGPATRSNLDEYINSTENAILKFSGAKKAKAILILNPSTPEIDMQTTIYAKIKKPKIKEIFSSVNNIIKQIQEYLPGYKLILPPTLISEDKFMLTIKVTGHGDYLPKYAGNLDIINCAAVRIAEFMAYKSVALK